MHVSASVVAVVVAVVVVVEVFGFVSLRQGRGRRVLVIEIVFIVDSRCLSHCLCH